VFILDNGKAVYVWVGSGASEDEKKNAMTYAHVSCFTPNKLSILNVCMYLELFNGNKTSSSPSDLPEARRRKQGIQRSVLIDEWLGYQNKAYVDISSLLSELSESYIFSFHHSFIMFKTMIYNFRLYVLVCGLHHSRNSDCDG